jgi:branched-chain amino acid transport system substrate-binding protein
MLPNRSFQIEFLFFSCVAIFSLSGCSLITSFDECTSNSDCASNYCSDGICEFLVCQNHNDCRSLSAQHICVRQACVSLEGTGCQIDEGKEDRNSRIVHVGGLMPLSGANAAKGQATANGAHLAFSAINDVHNGINGIKIGYLVCDTAYNVEQAVEKANYLVDDLGIGAIIGSVSSSETLAVAAQVAIPKGVLLISPASTSPSITTLTDNDLVWRTIASDLLQGPEMASLVEDLLPHVDDKRVAVLAAETAYGAGLSDAFQNHWRSEGRDNLLSRDRFDKKGYQVDDGELVDRTIVQPLTELFGEDGFAPHVVVIMGSVESHGIIKTTEDQYFSDSPGPIWVLSEAGKASQIFDEVSETSIWPRIRGTSIQQTQTPQFQDFDIEYRSSYGLEAADHPFADKAYDAGYLVALAYGTLGNPYDARGGTLATTLKRTTAGDERYGPRNFPGALAQLQGAAIDWVGASGEVDFDLKTGDVQSKIERWRIIEADGNGQFESDRDFCQKLTTICGSWSNTQTSCEEWWEAAEDGSAGDTSGATKACYEYYLGAADTGDSDDADTHCPSARGEENCQ